MVLEVTWICNLGLTWLLCLVVRHTCVISVHRLDLIGHDVVGLPIARLIDGPVWSTLPTNHVALSSLQLLLLLLLLLLHVVIGEQLVLVGEQTRVKHFVGRIALYLSGRRLWHLLSTNPR